MVWVVEGPVEEPVEVEWVDGGGGGGREVVES